MIVIFLLFQLLLFNQLHLLAQPVQLPQDTNIPVPCWTMPLSSAGVRNNYGQLGLENTNTIGDSSNEMANLSAVNLGTGRTATAIAAGLHHSCAVLDNASVKCWGYNVYGQLGIDSTLL